MYFINNETIHKVISRFQKENLLNKNISEGIKTKKFQDTSFFTWSQKYIKDYPGRPVISLQTTHTLLLSM